MVNGLYTSGRSMINLLYHQDLLSNNIANASTSGFKIDRLAQRTEVTVMNDAPEKIWRQQEKQGVEEFTNWEQGPMIRTGNELDLALQGDGFFQVKTPRGTRYVRAVSLRVDNSGALTNLAGDPVLAADGRPVTLSDDGRPVNGGVGKLEITPDGRVTLDGNLRGQLAVVDFPKPYKLHKENFGVMSLDPSVNPSDIKVANTDTKVMSGFLEGSNVNTIQQMVDMIASYRNYEADNRVVHAIDSTLDKAVNQVAKV